MNGTKGLNLHGQSSFLYKSTFCGTITQVIIPLRVLYILLLSLEMTLYIIQGTSYEHEDTKSFIWPLCYSEWTKV